MFDKNLKKKSFSKHKDQLFDQLLKQKKKKKQEVIYGVYDNSKASWFIKINDLYIDHYPISLKEKAYFFHLLAVLIDGGVPIAQALHILSTRTANEHFERVLNTLSHMLKKGRTLSAAMSRFADVFSESEIGVVKSGEVIGQLDKVLFKLSEQLDKANNLRTKLWTAAVYPIAVLIILGIVMIGMFTWVLPTLMSLLTESGVKPEDLPTSTKGLLFVQNLFDNHLLSIVFGILVIGVLVKVYIDSDNGRFWWHYYMLRMPVLGGLLRKVAIMRFIDKQGLLLDSGLSVIETLKIIASSTSNEIYALHTWRVLGDVEQGMSISQSLAKVPFLFPEDVTTMLGIGEKSATVAQISQKISEQYDKEISYSIKKLTSLFEPIMIVVVGLFVAVLALAIMGPIFSLTQSL